MIIPVWMLSSSVIIYNNYLYNNLNFKFPVFLATFHLGFAAIGTRVLERDDTPPRWHEGRTPHKGYVYALHSPHRIPLQRYSHPKQYRARLVDRV